MYTSNSRKKGILATGISCLMILLVVCGGMWYSSANRGRPLLPWLSSSAPVSTKTIHPNLGARSRQDQDFANGITLSKNAAGIALDYSVSPSRLYVADTGNNRVLGWSSVKEFQSGAAPEIVLGQPNFDSFAPNGGGVSARSLSAPMGLSLDAKGNLYVADSGNNRVLRFDSPFLTKDNTADAVFGQRDFTTVSTDIFNHPVAVSVGNFRFTEPRLYVADKGNSRIALFPIEKPGTTVERSIAVRSPEGVAVSIDGTLYVTDSASNQILAFRTSTTAPEQIRSFTTPGGEKLGNLAGQIAFKGLGGIGISHFGGFYVADSGNGRVLEFVTPLSKEDFQADRSYGGQGSNTLGFTGTPVAIAGDRDGTLYVIDQSSATIRVVAPPSLDDANFLANSTDTKAVPAGPETEKQNSKTVAPNAIVPVFTENWDPVAANPVTIVDNSGSGLVWATNATDCAGTFPGHSKPNSAAVRLSGSCTFNVGATVNTTMTFANNINLSGFCAPAKLNLNYVLDTEWPQGTGFGQDFDQAFIDIRIVGSSSFVTVARTDDANLQGTTGSATWRAASIPLPNSVIGKQIQLRFRFDSGDQFQNDGQGFYIDDIQITADNSGTPINATITANPNPVCAGNTVTLTCTAPGAVGFQWQRMPFGGPSFVNIPGANAAVYTFTSSTADNGAQYRCTVTGTCGSSISNPITLTVSSPPSTSADAGPDTVTCTTNPAPLFANTPNAGNGEVGTWTIMSTTPAGLTGTFSDTANPLSTFTPNQIGTYTLQWTISTPGCPGTSDTMIVTSVAPPSATVNPTNQTICANSATAPLGGNTPVPPATGLWSIVAGTGFFSNPANPNSTFTDTSGVSGQAILAWTVSAGSCPPASVNVTVTIVDPPTVATVGAAQTTCVGTQTLGLGGNTPVFGTGLWTVASAPLGGGGGFNPDALTPNATFTPNTAGTYTLQWTISNPPCVPSSAQVMVTATARPTATVSISTQTVCETTNPLATLTATITGTPGPYNIVWNDGFAQNNVTSPVTRIITSLGPGSYTFNVAQIVDTLLPGCPNNTPSNSVTLQVDAAPTTANAGPDQTVCFGPVQLAGNTPAPGAGTGTWTILPTSPPGLTGTFAPNVNAPNATFTPAPFPPGVTQGVYSLRWTIANGTTCPPSMDQVDITISAPPIATVGPAQTICNLGTTAALGGNTPSATQTGTWTIVTPGVAGNFIPNANAPGATFMHTNGGVGTTVTLRWTVVNNNGTCTPASADVAVTIRDVPTTANAGPDQTVCFGAIPLAGNTPLIGAGTWTVATSNPPGLTGLFANANQPNTTFTPGAYPPGVTTAVFTLQWTIANAPCTASMDTVDLTVSLAPVSTVGPAQTICNLGTTAGLGGNTPIAGGQTGTWSIVTAGVAGTFTPSVNTPNATFTHTSPNVNPGPLVVTLRWTVANNNGVCTPATADVLLTITGNPNVANAGPDQTLCYPGPVQLNASNPAPGTGMWTVQVTNPPGLFGIFSNATLPTSTFTPNTPGGVYTLRWTVTIPSCSTTFDDVDVTFNTAPVASVGPNQTICSLGTTTGLGGNTPLAGQTGTWSVIQAPPGFGSTFTPNANTPNATFTHTSPAATTVPFVIMLQWRVTDNAGACPPAAATLTITIVPNPTTANAGPDQTLCFGPAQLAANVPVVGTGTWSIFNAPAGYTGTFSNVNSPSAIFTPSGPPLPANITFTLRWSIVNAPCPPVTSDVMITYRPTPVATVGPAQTICSVPPNVTAGLGGNTPLAGQTGSWSIVTAGVTGTFTPNNTTPNATFTYTGPAIVINTVITLRWTVVDNNPNPCATATADVLVTVTAPTTVANAGPNQTLCYPTVATLAANAPAVGQVGTWTLVSPAGGGTFSNINSPTSTFTPTAGPNSGNAATVYTLMWTITNAPCNPTSSMVTLTYNPPTIITVQTAPTSQVLIVGQNSAAYTVSATGVNLTFQWFYDNDCVVGGAITPINNGGLGGRAVVVSGPNSSSLTINNSMVTDTGCYFCRVTGACGIVDSILASLTVSGNQVGTLYVADTSNNRIQRTTDSGLTWQVLGTGNIAGGSGQGDFRLPEAVGVNLGADPINPADDIIYVADTGNNRVQKSINGGTTWTTFAALGAGALTEQVRAPYGVVVSAAGGVNADVVVSDTGNARVVRYVGGVNAAATNVILATAGGALGSVATPHGLCFDLMGNLYLADPGKNIIMKFNGPVPQPNQGVPIATIGTQPNKVNRPQGVACDNANNLFVADTGNNRVVFYPGGNPAGAVVLTLGFGNALGQCNNPEGVAVTNFAAGPLAGTALIVSDTLNNRLQANPVINVPNPGGWVTIATNGTQVGQVRAPSKIR